MKELKDFPGYFVTEDGRVYSARKKKRINGTFASYIDYNDPKELKPRISSNGYYRVNLYSNGKMIPKSIHRIVAENLIENVNNFPCVNHIDEDKLNNKVSNLEWCSYKQNSVHSKCRWIWEIENIITGEIIKITNFEDFKNENNLDGRHLLKTLTGKRKQHKNFRVLSKTQFK